MAELDIDALEDIGHAVTGGQVVIAVDIYRAIIARLKSAERLEAEYEALDEAIRGALDLLTGWSSRKGVDAVPGAVAILNKALAVALAAAPAVEGGCG